MEAPSTRLGTAAQEEVLGLRAAARSFRIPDDIWDYLGLAIEGGRLTIPPAKAQFLITILDANGFDAKAYGGFEIHGARMGLAEEYDVEFAFKGPPVGGAPHTRENARIKFYDDQVSKTEALNIVYNLLHRVRGASKFVEANVATRGLRKDLPSAATNLIGRFVAGPSAPRPAAGPAAAGAPQGGRKKTRKPRRKSKKTLRRR